MRYNEGDVVNEEKWVMCRGMIWIFCVFASVFVGLSAARGLWADEKINFVRAEVERKILIDRLMVDASTEELDQMVAKSVEFRQGKLDDASYYKWLLRYAFEKNVSMESFKELRKFLSSEDVYRLQKKAEDPLDELMKYPVIIMKILHDIFDEFKIAPRKLPDFQMLEAVIKIAGDKKLFPKMAAGLNTETGAGLNNVLGELALVWAAGSARIEGEDLKQGRGKTFRVNLRKQIMPALDPWISILKKEMQESRKSRK